MNPFSAIAGFFSNFLLAGSRARDEAEQAGPAGRWNDRWLTKNGYEAQYQAYFKQHGTKVGFEYIDPGNPPPYPGGK